MDNNNYEILVRRILARVIDIIFPIFIGIPGYFRVFSKDIPLEIVRDTMSFPVFVSILYILSIVVTISRADSQIIGDIFMKIKYVDIVGDKIKLTRILEKEFLIGFLILSPIIWEPWYIVGIIALFMPVRNYQGKIYLGVDIAFKGEYIYISNKETLAD